MAAIYPTIFDRHLETQSVLTVLPYRLGAPMGAKMLLTMALCTWSYEFAKPILLKTGLEERTHSSTFSRFDWALLGLMARHEGSANRHPDLPNKPHVSGC